MEICCDNVSGNTTESVGAMAIPSEGNYLLQTIHPWDFISSKT